MLSIGQLSRGTGVKIPTIRYYEEIGLLPEAQRNAGNQRRYDDAARDRLAFIRHARNLGFGIEDIRALLELNDTPDQSCATASDIAGRQLNAVRARLARLTGLEAELTRIVQGCSGDGPAGRCYVLASLGDHTLCAQDHPD